MFKLLKRMGKREWTFALTSLVFILCQVYLDLKIPDYMSQVTMLVQTEGSSISSILLYGSYMLLCALGSLVSSFIVGYFAARIATGLSAKLRKGIFDRTLDFSMEEINRFSTSSLITRSTNDITQIQTFIATGLQMLVKAPITAIWAIVKIMGKSWQWTASTGSAVVLLLVMVSIIMIFVVPKSKTIQNLTDSLNRATRENLTGLRVVRSFNAEEYQEQKFENANYELTGVNLFANRIMAIMQPGMTAIQSGLTLSIYWIGAALISSAAMSDKMTLFSSMVVFTSYAMQVVMSFMMLVMVFIQFPRASVSAGRINEVLDTNPKILDGKKRPPKGVSGEIEFRNVSFKYSGAENNVLNDISFVVRKGETVAFIGSTGSGKSTLINLIPRFYEASEGEVLVDGMNVKDYTQEALHDKLGYVPQRAVLFSGSIESNIAYGSDKIDDQEVKDAMETAQGADFVESMDGGYSASVSQGGVNLSGGQKQRVSIARAFYKKPEIFIFDDSFSALDYKTDRALRKELTTKNSHITKLIVAQRIGTIKDADRIIVLDEGRIVGNGTHKELLSTCKVYQEIALSQLSKEELGYVRERI